MKRTTIFAQEELFWNLKEVAKEQGISLAQLIRIILTGFLRNTQKRRRKKLSFVGIGKSTKRNISETYKELLWERHQKE